LWSKHTAFTAATVPAFNLPGKHACYDTPTPS